MPDLSRELRRKLEATVKAAREAAETGAADALRRLAVSAPGFPSHLESRRAERNRLRAHARSLGDRVLKDGSHEIRHLTEAAAYVQWHRLLFARFLLARGLLRDETGIVIALSDCRDEAMTTGAVDEWSVAAKHAARLLPGVFPTDDPLESLTLAPEHAKTLRDRLRRLDDAIFNSDDSLGWTYQFWRAAEKKAVNDSQVKIGAAELPAVTQLFTEPYMVRFLLHNTLGAWWAGKLLLKNPKLAREAADEPALRAACVLPGYKWHYLRFVREKDVWRPAGGAFDGWPRRVAEITVLDPCCGSGHFLTEALAALSAMRMAEEGLTPEESVQAVLRDNLFGLEIDGRCAQIASFALALAAWRIAGAKTSLPNPHVAWSGALPPLPKSEFAALANGDAEVRHELEALHDLFVQAPLLGSLLEITGGDLVDPARIAGVEASVAALVERTRSAEPERAEGALAARGMADAVAILARRFVLQVTNVPFLGRGRQEAALKDHIEARFPAAKADLATAMLERMRRLANSGGTITAVTPQNWLFLGSYKKLRETVLTQSSLTLVGALGPRCFEMISGEVVNAVLVVLTEIQPDESTEFIGLDANDAPDPAGKAKILREGSGRLLRHLAQLINPDCRISVQPASASALLSAYADAYQGNTSGDNDRFRRLIWEIAHVVGGWEFLQSTVDETMPYSGRKSIIWWGADGSHIAHPQAAAASGRIGLAVSQVGSLAVTLTDGSRFDMNASTIIPKNPADLSAIWTFSSSPEFGAAVRQIDQALKVTTATLVKVPFDFAHWRRLAAERFPNGLPEPYSDDPTQWLFHGHPHYAESGTELHVALARLAGYHWPAESSNAMRLSTDARARIAEAQRLPAADEYGLLPLVPVLRERALADRLRSYCAAVWGVEWKPDTEAAVIVAACERAKDKSPKQLTFDAWLRTHAARQHAKLFHDRPFLWWITDGRAEGFTAIAHYHRLTRANLERLTWTMLGDWITRLGDDPRAEAAHILQVKLARILAGEKPFDIFVRWKSMDLQPLGWEPDLDDGVRLNIRPFIEAGVLAYEPKVKYGVDRGKDVPSAPWFAVFEGERRNDHHTTLAEKQAAREGLGANHAAGAAAAE